MSSATGRIHPGPKPSPDPGGSSMNSPIAAATVQAETPTSLETFAIDPDHSEVGFSVRHLLGRTRGRFARFEGEIALERSRPEASRVWFVVDPASIDTRQAERDAHLKSCDFLDVEHHPTVRLDSTCIVPLGGDRFRVEGVLALRNVRKSLALEVRYLGVARDPWGGERA